MIKTVAPRRQTSNYDLWLELIDIDPEISFPLVHCTIYIWSPSVMKELLDIWPDFRRQVHGPVFCCSPNDDDKFIKFVKRFGFRYFKRFIGPDDKEHSMFLHI